MPSVIYILGSMSFLIDLPYFSYYKTMNYSFEMFIANIFSQLAYKVLK